MFFFSFFKKKKRNSAEFSEQRIKPQIRRSRDRRRMTERPIPDAGSIYWEVVLKSNLRR